MRSGDPLWRCLALLDLPHRRVAGAVAAGIAALGSALALAAVAAWLIARAWEMPPVLDLTVAVVSVRALGIARGLFRYLERLASHDTAFRGSTAARTTIYRRLATGNPAAVTGLRRGDVLRRTGEDLELVAAVVVRAIVPIAVAVVVGGAAVVLLATISLPAAALLAAALVGAGVLAPMGSAALAQAAELDALAARAAFAERAFTALDHAAELRVAGRLDRVLADARKNSEDVAVATDRAAVGSAWAAAATPLAVGISVVGAVAIGIVAYGHAELTPMAFVILALLPLSAFEAVGPIPGAITALAQARAAATRIMALLDAAGEPGTSRPSTTPPPERIELRAATLRAGWPGATSTPPLTGTFAIGSRTAIVGASGSGKTSLLLTLAGLLAPVAGRVTVGGGPIGQWRAADVRRRISYFAEDAHLFHTSLLENLRVARGDVTADEAEKTLRAVGLGPWLAELPDGLDTVLVGGDAAVSGGQRRRILLARAILSPAEVLLLDEPTEHLDDEDGAALLRALLTRGGGLVDPRRTVIVVTHQLPADSGADQVIRLPANNAEIPLPPATDATTFVGTQGRRWSEVEEFQDA